MKLSRSALSLIAANVVTIVVAVLMKWDLGEVLWIYWGQSVVIGFYQRKRMLALKRFSTEGFTSNGKRVPETEKGKKSTANFFALHYGGFHLVYFVFLMGFGVPESVFALIGMAACIAAFIYNHHFSFVHNKEKDAARVPNIGTMMFFPYARILPMHLTIIFGLGFMGGKGSAPLVFFLALKTVADVIMHWVEHRGEDKSIGEGVEING